jgi:capsule biosynthesis phosphatase
MPHHSTTLVVDFDDTLAITLNRDWANAAPNEPLIEKLNHLYDEGWTIHVVTARGQISCGGDCEAASNKYRQQIENWLYEHGVKYTDLSFQKKLAAYYIDDKGITPDDFLIQFKRTVLKGGMSGAAVYYDAASDAVFKTAKNTASAVEWYKFAAPHYNVPKIHSVIGDTIKMEKLYEYGGPFERILNVCYDFRRFTPLHVGLLPDRYVDRCIHRISQEVSNDQLDYAFLDYILQYAVYTTPVTFGHGDFSISNIMSGRDGQSVYLIDPINDPTLLSSWLIDLGKLYMSIGFEFGDEDTRLDEIEKFALDHGVTLDALRAHDIGHLCRVYPYAPADKKEQILKRIQGKLQWFKDQLSLDAIHTMEKMTYVPR